MQAKNESSIFPFRFLQDSDYIEVTGEYDAEQQVWVGGDGITGTFITDTGTGTCNSYGPDSDDDTDYYK